MTKNVLYQAVNAVFCSCRQLTTVFDPKPARCQICVIFFQDFQINWNYIQSVFFSTTILTTIGTVIKHFIVLYTLQFFYNFFLSFRLWKYCPGYVSWSTVLHILCNRNDNKTQLNNVDLKNALFLTIILKPRSNPNKTEACESIKS